MQGLGKGVRSFLVVAGKLAGAALLFCVLLELGTRLLAPVDSFEYIPNTYDPVVGIRQIPGTRGFIKKPEFEIELRINASGLRDHDYQVAKPVGNRRILCLGDSFTNGFGVRLDQTFAKDLERGLAAGGPATANWQVINAGVGATGTAQQVAWFETEGYRYAPDVVVLTFSPNDFVDNAISGLWSLSESGDLVQHRAPRSSALKVLRLTRYIPFYETLFSRSHFVNAVKQRFARRHHARLEEESRATAPATAASQQNLALSTALIDRLAATCTAGRVRLAVMIVPPLPASGPVEEEVAQLVRHLERNSIDTIDLRPSFAELQEHGVVTNYPQDGHWTVDGHAAAAAALLAWLE